MGPGDSEAVECKCGMPLCICVVAPPKTSNPQLMRERERERESFLAYSSYLMYVPPFWNNRLHGLLLWLFLSQIPNQSLTLQLKVKVPLPAPLLVIKAVEIRRPDKPQKEYEVSGEGLREAIKNGDTAGVKKLLNEGVDANYHDKQGMSVLHLAVLFNQTEIALMLMEHGASLDYKNAQGETPLDCAPATLQYKMREKMKST
ncbi:hypothetical protein IGI04_016146 [Brassica rapa subsp. trilocularis]|uniref:PGG domain-containing protein n=1 Tax=Brassica rapa subsp. trilocularis TaxID=1813537 RepID=A0ABQ7MS52_BRACM|nr:hypothetical protein IGI04_016146 [Brassica rapa subsp. trilocularis]